MINLSKPENRSRKMKDCISDLKQMNTDSSLDSRIDEMEQISDRILDAF